MSGKIRFFMHYCGVIEARVDVSETFSANQLWFRAVSLWNSAVQLWNSTEFFSSEQRWFRENRSWSALKQSWSALIFFSCPLNQRWKTSNLWNSAVQRWLSLGLQPGSVEYCQAYFKVFQFTREGINCHRTLKNVLVMNKVGILKRR